MMPQLAGTTILGPQFIMQQAANPFSHHMEHQLQQHQLQQQQHQQQLASQKPPQPPSPPRIYEYACHLKIIQLQNCVLFYLHKCHLRMQLYILTKSDVKRIRKFFFLKTGNE